MLTISRRADSGAPDLQLTLPYDARTKSRLRTHTSTGEEVGLFLERGTVLRGGDLLLGDDGRILLVVAAEEEVSTVHAHDAGALARVSYHLGNRHVALQIGAGWVRYLHDHVLDDMVRGLGLHVHVERAPFEPEGGAYSTASHGHAHLNNLHDHSHA
jgi:urease accessory protein